MVESKTFDHFESVIQLKSHYTEILAKKHLKELLNDEERNAPLVSN